MAFLASPAAVRPVERAIARAVAKLEDSQRDDGRWEGIIAFGAYPTALALLACSIIESEPAAWQNDAAVWLAKEQAPEGFWGTAWGGRGSVGLEFEELVTSQVRRNTSVAAMALKRMGGFDEAVKRAEAWLSRNEYSSNDPLDLVPQVLAGVKGWGQMGLGDYVGLLAVDLTRNLPVWMVEMVAGTAFVRASEERRGYLSLLSKLVTRRMKRLLLDRQLQDGSWFGTVDETVYALLSLQASGQFLSEERRRSATESVARKRVPSRMIQRFSTPVWDTARSLLALREAGVHRETRLVAQGLTYLRRAASEDGLWGFSPQVKRYPDCDDTALAFLALQGLGALDGDHPSIEWLLGMQNDDGGWASFLRNQPRQIAGRSEFEDRSTPDVSAHVLEALAAAGHSTSDEAVVRGIKYLEGCQREDGSWYGRWGVCYLYGTTQVLRAFRRLGLQDSQSCARGRDWLISIQRTDGGWGEHPSSYYLGHYVDAGSSLPSQTGWVLAVLCEELARPRPCLARATEYLCGMQLDDGGWPSFPTSAAMEVYENTMDAIILPMSALAGISHLNSDSSGIDANP